MQLVLRKGYYKLHYKTEFQGLPVSVENKKGSKRYWTDENGEEGSTKMQYPYGYIRGTLGKDGDELDVFLGPDKDSESVFVVTQKAKDGGFKKVDEQKIMLGFSTAEKAKRAYLRHYDNPRFFGSMKELTMDEFKSKLNKTGKLIKSLNFGKIGDTMEKSDSKKKKAPLGEGSRFRAVEASAKRSGAKDPKAVAAAVGMKKYGKKKMGQMAAAGKKSVDEDKLDIKKDKDEDEMDKALDAFKVISKALTAATISFVARRRRLAQKILDYNTVQETKEATKAPLAGIAQPQPPVGTNREQDLLEPPVVPIRMIADRPPVQSETEGMAVKSCGACGYMHKSTTACSRCAHLSRLNEPAKPTWRR